MIRPNLGALLHAVAEVLEDDVLPTLPRGLPRQQLKAARSILLRVASVWHEVVPTLEEDNRDIRDVLRSITADLTERLTLAPDLLQALEAETRIAPGGDRYAALCEENEKLQRLLIEVQSALAKAPPDQRADKARTHLYDLYERMLRREARLSGRSFGGASSPDL